jgi:hypothetical protein
MMAPSSGLSPMSGAIAPGVVPGRAQREPGTHTPRDAL